jgi:hypothetical protein
MGAQIAVSGPMDRRANTFVAFIKMVQDKGRSFLDKVILMDESAVSMLTPEMKLQSTQWLKKGTTGPIKAKVIMRRTKQMVLAFFDRKCATCTSHGPRAPLCSMVLVFFDSEGVLSVQTSFFGVQLSTLIISLES